MFQFTLGASLAGAQSGGSGSTSNDNNTASPIKHVIVIIRENRSFDHVFATYKPVNGQTIDNLLSKQIIRFKDINSSCGMGNCRLGHSEELRGYIF